MFCIKAIWINLLPLHLWEMKDVFIFIPKVGNAMTTGRDRCPIKLRVLGQKGLEKTFVDGPEG